MMYIRRYEDFGHSMPVIGEQDRENFLIIFNSLYESHLSVNEKILIESNYGMINESWFTDLVDKGKRKVLKVASAAGQLLVDLAVKAKDILDFGGQLASKITDYLKSTFPNVTEKVKAKVLSKNDFLKSLTEFLDKKSEMSLKRGLRSVVDLMKYLTGGKFFEMLVSRISECFSKVLSFGTNEGLTYLEHEFLMEDNGDGEKKSFLARLGEAIMKIPPFSWIPKIEEFIKKGIHFVAQLVDRFFRWVQYGEEIKMNEEINLTRANPKSYGAFGKGPYGRGIFFLFQLVELYVFYEMNQRVGWLKKLINPKETFSKEGGDEMSHTEIWSNEVKGKTMEDVWKYVGLNPMDAVSKCKNAIKSIPYVGDFISILEMVFISVGIYLAVEPTLKKLTT